MPSTTHQNAPFGEYLETRRLAIDRALERLLPTPPDCPAIIAEIMRYSVFAGGKRLRPILTLATADTVSASLALANRMMPVACAIEMIHTYSLIHDDLPAMDDDMLRRGRPTAHVVYGEGLAILTGDALLTEAFGVVARQAATADDRGRVCTIRTLDRIAAAAGVSGMVGGQVLDLQATGQQNGQIASQSLRTMHACKTGALIRAAAVSGAIIADGSDAAVDAVDEYATHLGLAFQIIDDILDVEGTTDTLGKTVGKDAATGKVTYPALYGLEESRRLARASIADAKATLDAASLGGRLQEIADWVLSRST